MDYSGSNQPDGDSAGSNDFKYQYKDQPGSQGSAPPQSQPPPPPPPAKSFNWLACCGISCGVLAIIGLILGVVLWNIGKSAMSSFQPMIDATILIEETDLATIKAQSTQVSSLALSANPEAHTSGWLELEGRIIPAPEGDSGYPGEDQGTGYFLEGNVLLLDSSNAAQIGSTGDMVRCWGKAVKFDMTSMPIFGGLIEEAMKNDPNTPDLTNLILFMAKDIELVESQESSSSETPSDPVENPCEDQTDRPQDDGWL